MLNGRRYNLPHLQLADFSPPEIPLFSSITGTGAIREAVQTTFRAHSPSFCGRFLTLGAWLEERMWSEFLRGAYVEPPSLSSGAASLSCPLCPAHNIRERTVSGAGCRPHVPRGQGSFLPTVFPGGSLFTGGTGAPPFLLSLLFICF